MNAQLFKWSPDGWREGIPPIHGWFRIRFSPRDSFTPRVLVTPISETTAAIQVTERSRPELLKDDAMWRCDHESFDELRRWGGEPVPQEAICRTCGAHGKLLTRADLEVESA